MFLGEVASNQFSLGTRLLLDHAVFGRREYIVLDRIGYGSELDFYVESETVALDYGRKEIGFRVVR